MLWVIIFTVHRPSYLTKIFQTLICQSKELYSTALLSSLCATWPTRAFWHDFVSSTIVSWQQFFHIGQFHSLLLTVDVDIFFHILVVQWYLEWQPSAIQTGDADEIVFCIDGIGSNLIQYSLMWDQVVVKCNFSKTLDSWSVLKKKKSIQINFSDDI